MKKTNEGICHICGIQSKLSFEHIPPEAVFNKQRVKLYNILTSNKDKLPWDFDGRKYTISQRGTGKYTLCEQCNNNTGSWYGHDYAIFATNTVALLADNTFPPNHIIEMKAINIYPLRILKQIVAMFCSVNIKEFVTTYELRKFILDRYEKGIDKNNIRISLYIACGSILKQVPLSVKANSKDNSVTVISEMTTLPFGFVFDTTPSSTINNALDITDFANYNYDDCVDLVLKLPILETNTWFPADYRSQKEIIEQAQENLNNNN